MKTLILAAFAVLTLGVSVASAQSYSYGEPGYAHNVTNDSASHTHK